MAEVQGFCDPPSTLCVMLYDKDLPKAMKWAFLFVSTLMEKDVLDLRGGYADASQTELKPWGKDTITGVWSTTKIVTSLAALILVDRGLLDIDENVATYWPEFAANVSQILSHSSGVMTLERKLTPKGMEEREASVLKLAEELQSLDRTAARLADQPPRYILGVPERTHGFHLWTSGRRACVTYYSKIVESGLTSSLVCLRQEWARTADIIPFPLNKMVPLTAVDPTSILGRVLQGSLVYPIIPNKPVFRKSENGAMGGFSNARALARIGSLVSLDGTVDGKQYLPLNPRRINDRANERF
ncbi:beta-lactamase [Penicillium pulvis]|uniref:beta-lactamase n=1 Tax=Penicillium pulvis TaxID=1562058 RepID=UPI00254659D4|nr:beta-lactamase [Penicillium pulvis]KAJ5797276.1 beta-lactamase [Penicillium pulvis]